MATWGCHPTWGARCSPSGPPLARPLGLDTTGTLVNMNPQRLRGRGGSLVVIFSSMLVFASCACAPAPRPGSGNFRTLTITSDGAYSVGRSNGVLRIRNNRAGRGADTRVVLPEAGSPGDSVCATINPVIGGLSDFMQPGVALHIRTSGGRTTALTLTNNVLWGARWNWNVHYMDSGRRPTHVGLGSFAVPGFYREGRPMPPLPWRVCARTVGDSLQGKVWRAGAAEPRWGDPNFGGSVAIPSGLASGGESGVFAGHLEGGQELRYSNVRHP